MLDELPPLELTSTRSPSRTPSRLLVEYGDRAKILAGGTDLLGLMKDRIDGPGVPMPEVLVNVKTIPGWPRSPSGRTAVSGSAPPPLLRTSNAIHS